MKLTIIQHIAAGSYWTDSDCNITAGSHIFFPSNLDTAARIAADYGCPKLALIPIINSPTGLVGSSE